MPWWRLSIVASFDSLLFLLVIICFQYHSAVNFCDWFHFPYTHKHLFVAADAAAKATINILFLAANIFLWAYAWEASLHFMYLSCVFVSLIKTSKCTVVFSFDSCFFPKPFLLWLMPLYLKKRAKFSMLICGVGSHTHLLYLSPSFYASLFFLLVEEKKKQTDSYLQKLYKNAETSNNSKGNKDIEVSQRKWERATGLRGEKRSDAHTQTSKRNFCLNYSKLLCIY